MGPVDSVGITGGLLANWSWEVECVDCWGYLSVPTCGIFGSGLDVYKRRGFGRGGDFFVAYGLFDLWRVIVVGRQCI